MEKSTPARNSRTCTANLLTWSSDVPPPSSSSARAPHNTNGIGKVLFGGEITDEEAESLYKRKPSSGYKLKEMSGSNIFSAGGEDGTLKSRTVNGNANIRTSDELNENEERKTDELSFSTEEKISEKTPITLTEVEKQHELSGNQENKLGIKVKKQLSDAKSKELSGSNIFGPPIEVPPRSVTVARSLEHEESKDMGVPAPRTVRNSVKVSNPAGGQSSIFFGGEPVVKPVKKIHNQKVAELTGNGIFKGDAVTPPGSSEKSLSKSKMREMSGSGIFTDGKAESRVCYGGVRKPPGGDSSIRLF
ncbi:hypothetical protein T459_15023 [Capsicum annuum]|uniref:DUF4057 domain-containing protein n=1 Tax=Capsicum annuum TaxID=4072 RepID=A0A2G2ZJ35_CAPAN|nr:hypothetical protein T459_15023 [Capsicum annuum]